MVHVLFVVKSVFPKDLENAAQETIPLYHTEFS